MSVSREETTKAAVDETYRRGPLSSAVKVAIIATLLAYGALALYQLGTTDLDDDEARYGTSALNILRDYRQLAIVSPDPEGVPWSTWPYAYPSLLAGSMALFGHNEVALRMVNVVLMLLTAWCVYRLTASLVKDQTTALLAFGLFLLNPAVIAYARSLMAETSIMFWGCLAMVAAVAYRETSRSRYAALCGAALGLGFLSKLWLVLPFCAASALLLVSRLPDGKLAKLARDAGLGLVSFLIVAGSHLLLLRLLAPGSMKTWLATYFLSAATTRVAGAGYDPRIWYKPGWFYFGTVFKAQLFALPLLFAGIAELVRRRQFLALGCAAWLIGPVFVLSLFKVKEAPYICAAYPAMALLVACGLHSFFRDTRPMEVALSSLAAVAASVYFFVVGALSLAQLAMLLALYAFSLLAAPARWFSPVWRKRAALAAALATLLFADGVVVWRQLQHRTYYREIASYFKPRVGPLRAGVPIFTAPDFPALSFYLFRPGEYWESYYMHNSDELFRYNLEHGNRVFYLVDPTHTSYGSRFKPEWGTLLKRNTVDITSEVEQATGTKLNVQVLVPFARQQP